MTSTIDTLIKMAILILLVYISISVKQLQDEVFWDQSIMKPAIGEYQGYKDNSDELRDNVIGLLNGALQNAINKQEK